MDRSKTVTQWEIHVVPRRLNYGSESYPWVAEVYRRERGYSWKLWRSSGYDTDQEAWDYSWFVVQVAARKERACLRQ